MSWKSRRARVAVMMLLCGAWLATPGAWQAMPAAAQAPSDGPDPGEVGAKPIACWWRTGKNAVHVGERFSLTLTCRIADTAAVTVAPVTTEIEPTSIQLTPFDILDGRRHEDILAPPWRYFQYVYTARLLGDMFFGQDVNIPATNITYRIQSNGTEGVEHEYVMPAMPIRVMSLLPAQAADIRDASQETFGDIEAHRFRSTVALVAGAIFFAFAAVVLVVGLVRAVERARKRGPAVAQALPAGPVLQACLREIDDVKAAAARDGWSPALVSRALAPFRIGAAIALSQPVTHVVVDDETAAREGQIVLRQGLARRKRAMVFASITPDAIDRLRATGAGARLTPAVREALDGIRESMLVLNTARYGRNGSLDTGEIDRTLDTGSDALRRLRRARRWPARAAPSGEPPRHARKTRMGPLSDLLIVVRRTFAEWQGLRWSDLSFSESGSALLVLIVLLASSLLMLLARSARSRPERRAVVGVPAILSVMRRSPLSAARHAPFVLFLAGIPFFALALADPHTAYTREQTSYPGRRIALLVDGSNSMILEFKTKELHPSTDRAFFTAVASAERFMRLRMNGPYRDLIALIQFGNDAYVVTPFTTDYDNVLLSIRLIGDSVNWARFGDGGTTILEGIDEGMKLFDTFDFLNASGNLMVIFSDGIDTQLSLKGKAIDDIVTTARKAKVPVYMIRTAYNRKFGDVKEDNLWKPAIERTGGRFYPASDESMILRAVEDIDKLSAGRIDVREYTAFRPRFSGYALIAVALWLSAGLLKLGFRYFRVFP